MFNGLHDDAERYERYGPQPLVFIPGEDFDPTDPDDVAAVQLAMERDMADRARHAAAHAHADDEEGG